MAMLALSLSASATTFQVAVGQNNKLTFTPNTVNAKPGDKVEFNFVAAVSLLAAHACNFQYLQALQNHSVVSSTANSPCTPGQNAIFSGFQPVAVGKASPKFTVPITSTQPMYIYCSQTKAPSHCQNGMVMIINPPNGGAIAQFMQKAKTSGKSASPKGGITGGTITNNAAGTKPKKVVGVTPTPKAKAGTAGAKAAAKKNDNNNN